MADKSWGDARLSTSSADQDSDAPPMSPTVVKAVKNASRLSVLTGSLNGEDSLSRERRHSLPPTHPSHFLAAPASEVDLARSSGNDSLLSEIRDQEITFAIPQPPQPDMPPNLVPSPSSASNRDVFSSSGEANRRRLPKKRTPMPTADNDSSSSTSSGEDTPLAGANRRPESLSGRNNSITKLSTERQERESVSSLKKEIAEIKMNGRKPTLTSFGFNQQRIEREAEELESSNMWFGDEDSDDEEIQKNKLYDLLEGRGLGWKRRMRDIFDGNPHHRDTWLAVTINIIILLTITTSVAVFCVQSLPEFDKETYGGLFAVETACIFIFCVEVIARIAVTQMRDLMNIFFFIDILSIMGYFLDLILDLAVGSGSVGFSIFRIVRLIRVFRVLKVSRHSKALQLVYVVLRSSASGLTVLLIPVILIVTVSGCAIYFFELASMNWNVDRRRWEDDNGFPAVFQSIPDALWFCCETITTVGYGDIVTTTLGGRICAALVQLSGVLLLSFPNIVLGGNLQFAFKSYNRHRAVRRLGRKFRKVYMMLCFIAALRERVANRRALIENDTNGDFDLNSTSNSVANSISTSMEGGLLNNTIGSMGVDMRRVMAKTRKLPTNYLIPRVEVELYRKEGVLPITDDNVRSWSYKDITAVKVLQRLLEQCSGVGTTDELHQGFLEEGSGCTLKDIDIVCLYLMEAHLLQLFAFKKFGISMLCALTPQSVMELQLHAEEGAVECIRSAEVARVVWRRTVGSTVSFTLQQLTATYQSWACTERLVDNERFTPHTDFKVLHDPQKNPMSGSFSSFRRSSTLARRPVTAGAARDSANVTLEEAKRSMRDVLSKQQDQIRALQSRVREAEQQVTNMYGL